MSVCLRPKRTRLRVKKLRDRLRSFQYSTVGRTPRTLPQSQGTTPTALLLGGKIVVVDRVRLERSICQKSLKDFVQRHWEAIPGLGPLVWNWHLDVFCEELQGAAERVFLGLPKLHDTVVNVPPGTTKSLIFSVLFPIWVWTRMPNARSICGSYTKDLALDLGRKSRQVAKSEKFQRLFPEIVLSKDQDSKSYFSNTLGGSRIACSADGLITGFHAHFIIVDDPIDPKAASSMSSSDLHASNRWVSETLPSRKIDKKVTVTFLVMQRLHENDPSQVVLNRRKQGLPIRHIKLPAEITGSGLDQVTPRKYAAYYVGGLLDPVRLSREVLKAALVELASYGYSGQFLQNPVPLGGGMFKVEKINLEDRAPRDVEFVRYCRYWDKAGTKGAGCFTAGPRMGVDRKGGFWILDMVRGQWDSATREKIIRDTAKGDGVKTEVVVEQEPGSGGKESAENTIRNLAGYRVKADRPSGDKTLRADPLSTQINVGNVYMVKGPWNADCLGELRYFPRSTYKDQTDALSGAFNHLNKNRIRGGGLLAGRKR